VIIDLARAKVRRKARPLLTKSKRAPANMLVRSAMVLSSGRAAQGSGSSSFPGVGASVRAPIPRRYYNAVRVKEAGVFQPALWRTLQHVILGDTMSLIAFRHGLRASELCDLRWGRVRCCCPACPPGQERQAEHPSPARGRTPAPAPAPAGERVIAVRLRQRARIGAARSRIRAAGDTTRGHQTREISPQCCRGLSAPEGSFNEAGALRAFCFGSGATGEHQMKKYVSALRPRRCWLQV
jgi:hypothetical protein